MSVLFSVCVLAEDSEGVRGVTAEPKVGRGAEGPPAAFSFFLSPGSPPSLWIMKLTDHICFLGIESNL